MTYEVKQVLILVVWTKLLSFACKIRQQQPMNLSITGKKYTVQAPTPKIPESPINSTKKPTTKVLQHKPNLVKPKANNQTKTKPLESKNFSVQNSPNAKVAQKMEKEVKKEGKQVQVGKKEQPKAEVKSTKQEEVVQVLPKVQEKIGEVTVRYNHYKQKFQCRNSVLSFFPIEQKYCFSDVFKGNFIPVIKAFKSNQEISPETIGRAVQFSWKVQEQGEYKLQIQEDQAQEAKYEKKPFVAPQPQKNPLKKNMQVQYLTQQMKKMKLEQLGSDYHKQLLEQRDLQDVLFG